MTLLFIMVVLIGSLIGSFLNVCIYRVPRDLSIVLPSSRCPSCNTAIKPYDNIPLISFLVLGGRCRYCKARISLRYPLVEALNAFFYGAVLWRYGLGWQTPPLLALCSALLVITFIDLDFQIIPDAITIPGILIGLIASSLILPDPFARHSLLGFREAAIGLISGGGLFYLVAMLSRGGMGGGDIKMMAMVGAFMGWKSILLTTFAASLLGSAVGIFLMIFKGKGRKTKIPFGPFLAVGALITLFYGQEILALYLHR
ncbi:MAG: prepilin peptidase [Thermodesulfovibrionales bacterium]|jgi:leader peptidase (prepilin peptidase)/N-methyltransferase